MTMINIDNIYLLPSKCWFYLELFLLVLIFFLIKSFYVESPSSNKKIIPTMLEFVSSIKNTCNFENPYIVGTFQIKPT